MQVGVDQERNLAPEGWDQDLLQVGAEAQVGVDQKWNWALGEGHQDLLHAGDEKQDRTPAEGGIRE